IAGVLGAYMVCYPRARITTLVPIFFFIQFVQLPAFAVLAFWFVLQFLARPTNLWVADVSSGQVREACARRVLEERAVLIA
ncbi:MAG: hypothetical protein AAB322_08075, partial [Pseudomonadota bacterium]